MLVRVQKSSVPYLALVGAACSTSAGLHAPWTAREEGDFSQASGGLCQEGVEKLSSASRPDTAAQRVLWTLFRGSGLGLKGRSRGLDHVLCIAREEPKLHVVGTEVRAGGMLSFES